MSSRISRGPRAAFALLSFFCHAAPGCGGSEAEATPLDDAGADQPPEAGLGDERPDAGAACAPFSLPPAADCRAPADGPLPVDLRCTGLYANFDQRELACGVHTYKPAFELWSDDADKTRYVQLPPGGKVDTRDPGAFVFPIGTKFWKEFRVGGRRAETRLLEKSADGWIYTSYVWSADQRSATQMVNALGVPNFEGTGHVVPNREQCAECHEGRADYVLGWDAIMLGAGAEGVTRENLVALGLADVAPAALAIPGDEVERAALGYMHANCGVSCHNASLAANARDSGLHLRLEPGELDRVQATDAFRSLNKRPAPNAKYAGLDDASADFWYDVRPGDPARSLMVARQEVRGFESQMPPIGTRRVDARGVALVRDWIARMTEENGYPPPAP